MSRVVFSVLKWKGYANSRVGVLYSTYYCNNSVHPSIFFNFWGIETSIAPIKNCRLLFSNTASPPRIHFWCTVNVQYSPGQNTRGGGVSKSIFWCFGNPPRYYCRALPQPPFISVCRLTRHPLTIRHSFLREGHGNKTLVLFQWARRVSTPRPQGEVYEPFRASGWV